MSAPDALPPLPLATIAGFHAHVYFDGEPERGEAMTLRMQIGERFAVTLGTVREGPVGPHTRAMYQVAFETALFGALVPWLMLNRRGLSVLVHPNTRDERADHVTHALWLGAPLPIDPAALRDEVEAERTPPPNTVPASNP